MKRAADILVDVLEAQGVERAFGVPGESYLSVLDALFGSGIDFINIGRSLYVSGSKSAIGVNVYWYTSRAIDVGFK